MRVSGYAMSLLILCVVLLVDSSSPTVLCGAASKDFCKAQDEITKRYSAIRIRTSALETIVLDVLRNELHELKTELDKINDLTEREISEVCPEIKIPCDCFEYKQRGRTKSGVYKIHPKILLNPIDVYCDMDTDAGGWTVLQRRDDYNDPRQNFYLGWEDYKRGFGNLSREFWLGNENIFALTNRKQVTLRIDLGDWDGGRRYATYDNFSIASEHDNYRISFGTYSGNAGDSLSFHKNSPFTTKDRDNDAWLEGNCAEKSKGAWWYSEGCHQSNLNGLYLKGHQETYADGVNWFKWKGYRYSLKFTEMKIRPSHVNTIV